MERIHQKVKEFYSSYKLTISAGIIALELDQDIKDLLIKADQALISQSPKEFVISVAAP